MSEKGAKALLVLAEALWAVLTAAGMLLLPGTARLWILLVGLAGGCLALAGAVFCRAQLRAVAQRLSRQITAAQKGERLNGPAADGETLTGKLAVQIDRLADSTRSQAAENQAQKQELQRLIGDIAHQLRAPLANLALYAETLQNPALSAEERQRFAAIVKQQAHKLDFLVSALVKTSRLESGAIALQSRPADLASTLRAAAEQAMPAAAEKGLTLTVDCPALTVPHDPRWTAEAVFNLLDNGIKYTPAPGAVALTVTPMELYVRIQVQDTGPGIDPAQAAQLFQRFWRGTAHSELPGAGLGLYLARQIVQRQGGYIQASNAPEGGAVFQIFLPKEA